MGLMLNLWRLLKTPTFLLKLVELVLASLCIALVADLPVSLNLRKATVIHGTLIGYLIVNVIVILGNLLGTPLHQIVMLAITSSAALMYVTAGALLCETYDKITFNASGRLLGSGILGMINGCVYLIDTFFTFKEKTVTLP